MSDCPSPSELRRLEAGRLEADRTSRVREHVARCPACRSTRTYLCPTMDELYQYHSGTLSRDDEDRVAGHVAWCPNCTRSLQRLHPASQKPGTRIDKYVLQEFLGRGGFGEVYRAQQVEGPRIEVAFKILREDRVSPAITARFDIEIEAMALVDHPNIAKVFDSGRSPAGTPYFVMEYVRDGLPLTTYCDRQRLNIARRVALFRQVCDAVTHAHQKGIIHRDLTPRNILVREAGDTSQLKVIDFGLAKLLGQAPAPFDGQRMGTPGYMAPEQIRGSQGIDARADVYALGVLFHDLLIGVLPHQVELERLHRQVLETAPARPSRVLSQLNQSNPELTARNAQLRGTAPRKLGRSLRPDLDWVVLKCLNTEANLRYRTVDALAEDVRHFQAGRPVSVRENNVAYRMRKFVSRNRWGVAAAVALTAVASAGLLGWLSERTRAEAAELREARMQARQLIQEARLLVYAFPGEAERGLRQAIQSDGDFVEARLELAHLRFLQERRSEARAIVEEVRARHPESVAARAFHSALVHEPNTDIERMLEEADPYSDVPEQVLYYAALGEEDRGRQIELLTRSLDKNPWQFAARSLRGVLRYEDCDYEAALEDAETLVKVGKQIRHGWVLLGAVAAQLREYERAIKAFEHVTRLDDRAVAAHYNLGLVKSFQGEVGAARRHVRRAIELAPADPQPALLNARLLVRDRPLITTADDIEWYRQAEAELDRALELGGDASNVYWYRGQVRRALGDFDASLEDLAVVLDGLDSGQQQADAAGCATVGLERNEVYMQRGLARLGKGDYAKAEADFRSAMESRYAAAAAFNLGRVLWLRGDYEAALEFHLDSIERAPEDKALAIGRGLGSWALDRTVEALDDFDLMCGLEGYVWTCLWSWEIATLDGDPERARRAATRALESTGAGDEAMLGPVIEMLHGQRDPEEVVRAAANDLDRLYAHYFAGVHASIAGNREQAIEWFDLCLANRRMADQLDYDLCLWKRSRLD